MLEISSKTNLLEQKSYKYSLQDVEEPNLQRDIYSYGSIPKVAFNHRRVPVAMPEEIWITDTSLRDGQQSVEPYTVEQIVNIYKLLSKLGGPYGIIRQTEFFIYSRKDREALEKCREMCIRRVLMFCDKDNPASARTIQKNGGRLENEVLDGEDVVQRYWIDT